MASEIDSVGTRLRFARRAARPTQGQRQRFRGQGGGVSPGEGTMSEQRPVTWPQELEEALRARLAGVRLGRPDRPRLTPKSRRSSRRIIAAMCEIFWEHYLAHPGGRAPVRDYYTPERSRSEIDASVALYARQVREPAGPRLDGNGVRAMPAMSDRAGVPLAPLLVVAHRRLSGRRSTSSADACAGDARANGALCRRDAAHVVRRGACADQLCHRN